MTVRAPGSVLLAGVLVLGGCSVSAGSSRPDNAVVERALETDALRLDLTDGLTATEIGGSEAIVGHTGGEPTIAVTLDLPGVTLRRDVSDLSARTDDPDVVDLYQRNLDIDAAESLLEQAVDDLGLDATLVEEWADAARARTPEEGYAPRVLRGAGVEPWSVEVSANQSPGRDVVTLHTILTLRP